MLVQRTLNLYGESKSESKSSVFVTKIHTILIILIIDKVGKVFAGCHEQAESIKKESLSRGDLFQSNNMVMSHSNRRGTEGWSRMLRLFDELKLRDHLPGVSKWNAHRQS